MKPIAPEYASIEAFLEFCVDDEKDSFLPGDAQKIAEATGRPMKDIIAELKSFLKPTTNHKTPEGRGMNSNDHDKFSAKNGWVGGCGIGNASRHMVSGWQPT